MRRIFNRIILAALIITQVAAFAFMTGTRTYPAIIGLLVLLGAWGRFKMQIRGARELIASLALALPFVALWRMFPGYGPDISGLVDARLTYAMGQYLLLLQASNLFVEREDAGPARLVVFGALTFVCAGNVYLSPGAYLKYRVLSMTFAVLAIVFLGAKARYVEGTGGKMVGKYIFTAFLLVLSMALAIGGGHLLKKYETELNQVFFSLMRDEVQRGSTGFSRDSRLGSVVGMKNGGSRGVALRIFSRQSPGYLRGQAYTRYKDSEWKSIVEQRSLSPSQRYSEPGPKNVFVTGKMGRRPWKATKIWPDPAIREGIFTPLCARAVEAPAGSMEVDENGIYSSGTLVRGVPYSAYCSGSPSTSRPPSDPYLSVPPLDRRVHRLAQRLFSGRQSTTEKIAAVTSYFHRNYIYALDISIPEERDPLNYFLLEKPAAHCEYFASGTAILLRLGGVPTRYVAGFMTTERNKMGGYWVARHKDAHAWVEAYIPGTGWTVVESTPASGVPNSGGTNTFWELWDYLRYRMQELMVELQIYGLKGLLWWVIARAKGMLGLLLSSSWMSRVIRGLMALFLIVYLVRRWRKPGERPTEADEERRRMQRLLERMDRRLGKRGMSRSKNETLHQFARRIRDEIDQPTVGERLAGWYVRYARIRYGEKISSEVMKELERTMPDFKSGGG